MRVVLLHNEKAGNYGWSRKDLIKMVERAGFEPAYFPIREALADKKILEDGEFVIVAGGDGAIRKTALALLGTGRAIAPLPLGTANNISRSLGLVGKVPDITRGWKKPRRVKFDIGVAAGPWGHRHFIEGVGLGLISRSIAVIDDLDEVSVHEWRKAKHKLHRDACVAAALAHEMQALPVKLELNGTDASNKFLLLEFLNIRAAGPAVELAPDAHPSDGRFNVVTVTEEQRARLLIALKARLADEQPRNLTTRYARDVRFSVSSPCDVRIDDGTVKLEPGQSVQLTVEKAAVHFLLPKR